MNSCVYAVCTHACMYVGRYVCMLAYTMEPIRLCPYALTYLEQLGCSFCTHAYELLICIYTPTDCTRHVCDFPPVVSLNDATAVLCVRGWRCRGMNLASYSYLRTLAFPEKKRSKTIRLKLLKLPRPPKLPSTYPRYPLLGSLRARLTGPRGVLAYNPKPSNRNRHTIQDPFRPW